MDYKLYIFKASTMYLIVLKTQNTTILFKLFLPLMSNICIILLVFINFQNVKFQSIFDNKLKELAITSFQILALYYNIFGVSIEDARSQNISQS